MPGERRCPPASGLGLNTYATIRDDQVAAAEGTANATYVISSGGLGLASGDVGRGVFHLDPATYAVSGRTTKLRTKMTLLTNAVASGCDFTLGLYPVTACTGAVGAVAVTLDTVVSGSTAVVAAPAADTRFAVYSSDFDFPAAAGWYCLGLVLSATTAANSRVAIRSALELRRVGA